MQKVIIITGPPGSGKTTISNILATSVKKGAAIHVDDLRSMIKAGYENPWTKNEEAKKQLLLAATNACTIAKNFIENGCDVFIDDVVLSEEMQDAYIKILGEKTNFFLLLPPKEILLKRDSSRNPGEVMGKRAEELHNKFTAKKKHNTWKIIDNSHQTPKETAKLILDTL